MNNVTTRDLLDFVRKAQSSKVANTMKELIYEWADLDSFFKASKGDLMAAYSRKHPNQPRGLGARFFAAMDLARDFACRRRIAVEAEKKAEAQEERRKAEGNPAFSLAQMKALVDFMEYCNLGSIDLKGAVRFFAAFGLSDAVFNKGNDNTSEIGFKDGGVK